MEFKINVSLEGLDKSSLKFKTLLEEKIILLGINQDIPRKTIAKGFGQQAGFKVRKTKSKSQAKIKNSDLVVILDKKYNLFNKIIAQINTEAKVNKQYTKFLLANKQEEQRYANTLLAYMKQGIYLNKLGIALKKQGIPLLDTGQLVKNFTARVGK